ncbi:MAG TPA: hypothetical protein VHS05_21075 [Pyrinomonadaceae bacterium]|jgi:uncharacterized membrane protein YuzA (DUF378 family)|nr:hypothetical protein [Pyrinomonadaceae bacterium]
MRFAKIVFLVAGIYGLIVLVPQYFFEERTGHDYPPPITHPEYYYGFIGLAVVWQILFLILSRDPVRYRPMMIPAILEKACFAIPAVILLMQHRIPGVVFGLSMVDVFLGVLFAIAYMKTRSVTL